ncbi:MAG TPA: tetratricopeptide repeat protein, partial [Aggregatilineales bacterium]|nr:tetratricopeptide repeat protein [Aggregatilineales bacterium]
TGISAFEGLVQHLEDYLTTEPHDIHVARQILARASVYHAVFKFSLGDRQEASEILERYITYWRELNNTKELASTLTKLGMVYNDMGLPDKAKTILQESLTLWQTLNHPPSLARVYNNLGVSAVLQEHHEEAYHYLLQCLTIYKTISDYVGISRVYNNLGNMALGKGDLADALQYFEHTYKIQQQYKFESHWTVACTVLNLGVTQQRSQNLQKARQSIYQA